jgi:hypothetical protein
MLHSKKASSIALSRPISVIVVGVAERINEGLATGVGEAIGVAEAHPVSTITTKRARTIISLIRFFTMVHLDEKRWDFSSCYALVNSSNSSIAIISSPANHLFPSKPIIFFPQAEPVSAPGESTSVLLPKEH